MVLYPRSNSLHMCYLSLLVGILMDELWRIYISSQCPCSSALRGPTDPHQNSPHSSASPACSTCCDALPVEETLFQHGAARMVAECGLGSLHRHGAQIPTLQSGRSLSPKPASQPVAETLQLNNWHPRVRSLWSGILTIAVCGQV